MSNEATLQTALQAAQRAIKAGRTQEARQLLQETARQNPQDFRVWLWLAIASSNSAASQNYLAKAEQLSPHNPQIIKARAWLAKQNPAPQTAPKLAATADEPPLIIIPRWAILLATAVILLTLSFATLWWWQMTPATVVAAVNMGVTVPAVTATPMPTFTPTPIPPQLPAKEILPGALRDMWTPTYTPTPTETPPPTATPLPTYAPTFVANKNYANDRPMHIIATQKWVDVDLTNQTLRAYLGNGLVYETLISSGTWEYPTVTGQFRVWLRYEKQTMDGRLLGYDYFLKDVPYVMYFYQDYALHGTFWHNNFGTPTSHGCVNLRTSDAKWLYEWSDYGMLVNVHY